MFSLRCHNRRVEKHFGAVLGKLYECRVCSCCSLENPTRNSNSLNRHHRANTSDAFSASAREESRTDFLFLKYSRWKYCFNCFYGFFKVFLKNFYGSFVAGLVRVREVKRQGTKKKKRGYVKKNFMTQSLGNKTLKCSNPSGQ